MRLVIAKDCEQTSWCSQLRLVQQGMVHDFQNGVRISAIVCQKHE